MPPSQAQPASSLLAEILQNVEGMAGPTSSIAEARGFCASPIRRGSPLPTTRAIANCSAGHARVEDAKKHAELFATLADPDVAPVVERFVFVDVGYT